MQSLKEILIDAARYRWLREKTVTVVYNEDEYTSVRHPMLSEAVLDSMIDRELQWEENKRGASNE